jgi:glycerol-3-phosphate cytidylyltransferase-like family protein
VDTRTKIITADQAQRLAEDGATTVSGYFDPLTLAHAERLQSLKRPGAPLLVVISSPPDPILPSLARAQLVAGLACVDHVTEAPVSFTPDVQLEHEDDTRLDQLIQRVQARQQAASSAPARES